MVRSRSVRTATVPLLGEGLRVLLVDEDLQNLTEMQCFLENNTYKVTAERSTTAALSMILEKECPYDIAIAEIAMPDIDGFMFLQQIKAQHSNFPVILMSANMEPGMEEKARGLGATMFLKKPVPESVMVNIWENVPLRKLTIFKRNGRISRIFGSRRNIHGDCGIRNSITTRGTAQTPKTIWSEELHREFNAIVAELGEGKAKPQEILRLMNDPNLTLAQISNYLHLQRTRMRVRARKMGISMSDSVPSFFITSDALQPPLLHPMSADAVDPMQEPTIASVSNEKNPLDWEAIAEQIGIPFDELEALTPKDSHRFTWCLDDLPNLLW